MSVGTVVKVGISIVALLAAIILLARFVTGGSELAAAADEIEIVCAETGESWTMERGRLMDSLYQRGYPIDPDVGLGSPHADGRPVAFPANRQLWNRLVDQVNQELQAFDRGPG